MMRLRRGKFWRRGGRAGRELGHQRALPADALEQRAGSRRDSSDRGRCRSTAMVLPPQSSAPSCAAVSMPRARPLVMTSPAAHSSAAICVAMRRPAAVGCRLPTMASCGWRQQRDIAEHEQRQGASVSAAQLRREVAVRCKAAAWRRCVRASAGLLDPRAQGLRSVGGGVRASPRRASWRRCACSARCRPLPQAPAQRGRARAGRAQQASQASVDCSGHAFPAA